MIEEKEIPLTFDGRKLFLNIRRPSYEELHDLESFEITSPAPFEPEKNNKIANVTSRRKDMQKMYKVYPGGLSMNQWRKRLAMAPEDVIRKTFESTTQMSMNIEAENRTIGRRHYKSRFPFLREKRLNDVFHSDTFFPTIKSREGHTCSQLFIGRETDYMYVQPLKRESHSFTALQDFGRKVGLPRGLKTDNAQTEVGTKWTEWCRNFCVDTKFTEPHSPWQNIAEQGIGDLGRMVKRCMREFNAPYNRHAWCQKWCADVRNHLASRKLDWRTPTERLTGETPDISMFHFHFWEDIKYFDPTRKQPEDGWLPGRFLGLAHDYGDDMTYFVETDKKHQDGRNVVLVQSTIRPRKPPMNLTSGEKENEAKHESTTSSSLDNILMYNKDNESTDKGHGDRPRGITDLEEEDYEQDHENNDLCKDDQLLVNDELNDIINEDEEDYEFEKIINHKWEDGVLIFEVELTSGKTYEAPFALIKKDRPLEVAKYIRREVIEKRRGGKYEEWAKGIINHANRTIQRISRYHNIDRIMRLTSLKEIKVRRISKNKRDQMKKREKFGVRIPNNVREALIYDREAGNTLWADAIKKEMTALNEAKVFEYHSPHFEVGKDYQYCPLRIIFDIKQEDLRRKTRLVAGGHVIDSTMYESYSSVVQTRTVRLLQTVTMNEDLNLVTGDIGNAFVQALTTEKVWSRAGREFGNREGCVVIIKKALYGLATSAQRWSLALGDVLREMGFKPSRADPDLWIKLSNDKTHYEYIATHVDDVIVASKEPDTYISKLQEKFPIRNVKTSPEYYLGNDLEIKGKTMRVSCTKYITEILRRYENKYGQLRKENVPASPGDHPEMDDTPLLDKNGVTHFQSVVGITQWISIAGRFDITFAVSSISRFSSKPTEGHLKRAIKILGYLKKYPKKSYTVDPRPPIVNFDYEEILPDFGNQYADFVEEIDHNLPEIKMKELPINIFVDSNHGHDKVTGKSITGLMVFVGRTPISWSAKRQGAEQTSTFGAEFVALKKAVEEAITTRYYLRSMGVKVSLPTTIYGDNLSAITNTIEPGSPLKKKYLALSYHFCREHFSAGVVSIRKIDGKHNYGDPFTKALVSNEFHGLFNEIMMN